MFGGFGVVYCSKCGEFFSCLEGLVWCIAPNVGNLSRVWRVWSGILLQAWGTFLAFGGLLLVLRSKCAQLFSRLEGCGWFGAPNEGNLSRVWRVVESSPILGVNSIFRLSRFEISL